MNQIFRNFFIIIVSFTLLDNLNSQTVNFIEGIKNDWSFFRDRIIYSDNSGIFYRLSNDTKLYYSNGTTAGSKATSYVFGADAFVSPDLGVFVHDDQYTALGTDKGPHDIIIFKDKSSDFEYVEKGAKSFKGMTFLNGKLYYLFSKVGNSADKLMEYDPVSKTKNELLSFNANGAFGICAHKDHLLIIGYLNGNKLISFQPSTSTISTVHTFETTNTTARAVNMGSSNDQVYFWYPNGASTYSLFVTKGIDNSTLVLMDDFIPFDDFSYYTRNILKLADGKLMANVKLKGDPSNERILYSDGTVEGTKLLEYNNVIKSSPYGFAYYCNRFFFIAKDENGSNKLFSTNGTYEGTKVLSNNSLRDIVLFNNRLYLSDAGLKQELYAWNDKTGQIEFVLDVNMEARPSEPRGFKTTKNQLFMMAVRSNLDLSYKLAVMEEPIRENEDCSTVSTLEQVSTTHYTLFPNPANFDITLTSEDKSGLPLQIVLLDITGKILREENHVSFPINVTTSDLPAGIYLISVLSNTKKTKEMLRFVKL